MEQSSTSTSLYARFEAYATRRLGLIFPLLAGIQTINAIVSYSAGNTTTAAFSTGFALYFALWSLRFSRHD